MVFFWCEELNIKLSALHMYSLDIFFAILKEGYLHMEVKFGATVGYFLWSLLAGGVLALIYDLLRSSRRLYKTSVFSVNMEDVLFSIVAGGLLFWIAFSKNDGRIRFQGFLGVFLGFWMYRKLFRDRIVRVMVWVYQKTVQLLVAMLRIVLFPVQLVYRMLAKPFLVVAWYSKRGLSRAERIFRMVSMRQKFLQKRQRAERKRRKIEEKQTST